MKNLLIKVSLFINYFVFAILLNSVGAVILQLQRNLDISKADVSVLEAFKDLPIAIASFLVASFLPKIGIKKGMMFGLIAVGFMCFAMPFIADDFWHYKLLFATVGVAFAIIKIGVFSIIGLVSENDKEHRSLMSWIEGFFMIGVLAGNLVISWFIDDNDDKSTTWLNVYYMLGALSIMAALFLMISPLDESEAVNEKSNLKEDFFDMLRLAWKPLIAVFVICAFLFVLIEQSFQTWMPTFYSDMLHVPAAMSIQAGSILAGAFAIGRIAAGFVLKKMSWLPFVLSCLAVLAACVLINVSLAGSSTINSDVSWTNAPLIVYVFPLMGLFLAPIYPTINSVILTSIPKHLHASMSGLIVVFSALGGTLGSMITGNIFQSFDGFTAFTMSLIPMALLALSLIFLNKFLKNSKYDIT